jgi:hypothetical protein
VSADVVAMREAVYARPSGRPGCVRAHDETWDLIDPDGYSLREIEPGHWHVVAGPNLCGWFCTGGAGCLSWVAVVARFGAAGAERSVPGGAR